MFEHDGVLPLSARSDARLRLVPVPASGSYVPSRWSLWYEVCPRCGEPVLKDQLFRTTHEDHHALLGR